MQKKRCKSVLLRCQADSSQAYSLSNGIFSVKTNRAGWYVLLFFPLLLRCTFSRKPMSSHFLSMFNNEVVDLHGMFQDLRKWLRVIQQLVFFLSVCTNPWAALQGLEISFVLEVVSFRRDVKPRSRLLVVTKYTRCFL